MKVYLLLQIPYGQLLRPKDMRKLISSIGKIPAQRTSNYKIIKEFETKEELEYESNLDRINPSVFSIGIKN